MDKETMIKLAEILSDEEFEALFKDEMSKEAEFEMALGEIAAESFMDELEKIANYIENDTDEEDIEKIASYYDELGRAMAYEYIENLTKEAGVRDRVISFLGEKIPSSHIDEMSEVLKSLAPSVPSSGQIVDALSKGLSKARNAGKAGYRTVKNTVSSGYRNVKKLPSNLKSSLDRLRKIKNIKELNKTTQRSKRLNSLRNVLKEDVKNSLKGIGTLGLGTAGAAYGASKMRKKASLAELLEELK